MKIGNVSFKAGIFSVFSTIQEITLPVERNSEVQPAGPAPSSFPKSSPLSPGACAWNFGNPSLIPQHCFFQYFQKLCSSEFSTICTRLVIYHKLELICEQYIHFWIVQIEFRG